MRRLFDKVLNVSLKEKQVEVPSLPSDLAYSDLTYMTKRGFLAKKLSNYLSLSNDEGNSLFYLSLSEASFLNANPKMDRELLLNLSEQMLTWSEKKQDIPEQIIRLDVRNDIQNAMLKVYEIHKDDVFSSPEQLELQKAAIDQEDTTWQVYRDVIAASTQGRFLLIAEEEINKYREGNVLCQGNIKVRSDIPRCRDLVKEILEQRFSQTKVMSLLLVLSEAITNTIKHAEEGKMTLVEDVASNEIRFLIEDKGPGFALKDLPKMTLLAGFSTKKSMGQGFTLMMKMSKQVSLYTSLYGSTVILTFQSGEETKRTSVI
ncbi:ATP-binding protein [Anaerobacillus sp. MEB173]|uniref:ATP-binding protein n=1 Tax=Anaerobacillus sp. MEB173 TaxID=3383345 RepID=UPI003F8E983B